MKRCEMRVIPALFKDDMLAVLYCATCYKDVASADEFTTAEIAAAASGHRQVVKRGRALQALHEKKSLDSRP